jgi:putative ABC transport system permease protein
MPNWRQYIRQHLQPLGVSGAREQEIVEELAQQIEQAYNDELAAGSTPARAAACATKQFGDWQALAAEIRHAERPVTESIERHVPDNWKFAASQQHLRKRRGGNMFADFFQDVRYASRMLRKNLGFAALVILTLALGIGANSVIFSVINAVLLRPLPYPNAGQLMTLYENNPTHGFPQTSVSPANFTDWRSTNRSFENIAAMDGNYYTFIASGTPQRLLGLGVTPGFLEILGVHPILGRGFLPEDYSAGNHSAALLSYSFWQNSFGGDRTVAGRSISLDGKSCTIIGILPPKFQFLDNKAELWTNRVFSANEMKHRGGKWLTVIARTKSGLNTEQANADLAGIARQLAQQYPNTNTNWSAYAVSMHDDIVGDIKPALILLLVAVGLVLLIACANAASMLVARSAVRQRELAIRAALGAGRARLVRQALTESVLLSLYGAAAGLLLVFAAIHVVRTLPTSYLPMADSVSLDGRVLAFTLAIALVTGIFFGSVPALISARDDVQKSLREGGRGITGAAGARLRNILVVAEVAMSLVVLAGAALLLQSFQRLSSVPRGFRTDHAISFMLHLSESRYPKPAQQAAFLQDVEQHMDALPGVEEAALTTQLPLSGDDTTYGVTIANVPEDDNEPSAAYAAVTPAYFRLMGIPLIAGRLLTAQDTAGSPQVCVVNDVLAKAVFPNGNALGQHIQLGYKPEIAREIVGIVGTVKAFRLAEKPRPEVYESIAQMPDTEVRVVLRAAREPAMLMQGARERVRELDSQIPISEVRTLDDMISESVALPRFRTVLLGVFAALAVLLASIGLYGVLSYSVTQRTQEIGIRMALGAQRRDIYSSVLGRGVLLVGLGLAIGVMGALGLTRFLQAMLYGVTPRDPVTLLLAIVFFTAVAALACWIPARRASQVDPLVALRHE